MTYLKLTAFLALNVLLALALIHPIATKPQVIKGITVALQGAR